MVVVVNEQPAMNSAEENYVANAEHSVRRGFIQKVYGILSIQLLVTAATVLAFTLHKPLALAVRETPACLLSPSGPFSFYCALLLPERCPKVPHKRNLSLFTVCESILVSSIALT